MRAAFLIGFPGCGKTTLGAATARVLGCTFTDLDEYIEQSSGRSIARLYSDAGEDGFRLIEQQALRAVARRGGIVSCGGGTPCYGANMELMNAVGITVWLTVSEECLTARLCLPEHRSIRPQIASLDDAGIAAYVHTMLSQRTPWYAQAQMRFDSTMIETAADTEVTAQHLARVLLSVM